ncbi:hypothetical protein EC957_005402 [Mortierella hygrophila]|uniref:F-box domain-containing protein n=1 Tax=Mortierella hygrophila TaxID=979708 RepID=A0A9P6F192_9FUNG|nr:hypothetical protein EC957_005402 [Mortierella hygrophila]
MQIARSGPPNSPFDLSEVRTRIASFLDHKDCLSCIRVSRAWFHDFVPAVWHTIDFARDATAFAKVTPEILEKYGGFISEVLNTSSVDHLQLLQHSKVNSLKVIKSQLVHVCMYHLILSDTFRRSQESLQSLDIQSNAPNPDTLEEQRRQGQHFLLSMDAISSPIPSSPLGNGTTHGGGGGGLRILKLSYINITRETFSNVLRRCPGLQELDLHHVLFLNHKPSISLFTKSKLRRLVASFSQVWKVDPNDRSAPSLLAHFPLLKEWRITSLTQPTDTSLVTIREEITRCCPLLYHIQFNDNDSAMASYLLTNTFTGLQSCCLLDAIIDSSTVFGLVTHRDSLTSVSVMATSIADIDYRPTTIDWLYMIPRFCQHLQVLDLESYLWDIHEIEDHWWVCEGLQELRVRFKGLNTPQDIDDCLKNLCDLIRSGCTGLIRPRDKDTVSTRVVRHLLRFKQLRTVWLGTEDYCVPRSSA